MDRWPCFGRLSSSSRKENINKIEKIMILNRDIKIFLRDICAADLRMEYRSSLSLLKTIEQSSVNGQKDR